MKEVGSDHGHNRFRRHSAGILWERSPADKRRSAFLAVTGQDAQYRWFAAEPGVYVPAAR